MVSGVTEFDHILEAMKEWDDRGIDFALATVVGVRGSTYRGLAARQLVAEGTTSVGTISGGCLDNDLHLAASEVIESGAPMLVEFDLTADDEAIWGWGIGCNGATEVLIEPRSSALEFGRRLERSRHPLAVVHSLDPDQLAERRYVRPVGESPVVGQLAIDAQEAMVDGRHRIVTVEGSRSLIEVVGSPSRLLVCGAGHDADPVVRLGHDLGFAVTVTDPRRHLLTTERFPSGTELIHTEARDLSSVTTLDERTYVVLMSHNYLRDLAYLEELHGTSVPYVGALGPAERLDNLVDDLAERGLVFGEAWSGKLRGPAGLDIGAEGPVEIAWSILSEIMAVRAGRKGGPISVRKRSGMPDQA